MSIRSNLLFMAGSTVIRLGSALATFSLLGRVLGTERFGLLMYWLSASMLIGLIANYGQGPYILREVAANPDRKEQIIDSSATAKLILSLSVFALAAVAVFVFSIDSKVVFLCLTVASLADNFTEFLNAGLRAQNFFHVETIISTLTAILQAVIIMSVAVALQTVETTAVAYLISRLTTVTIVLTAIRRASVGIKLSSFSAAVKQMRRTKSYAIDCGLQNLFGQIDSIVLNGYLGSATVGIYQAGMKIFMAGTQVAAIVSNVYLPHLSRHKQAEAQLTRSSTALLVSFTGLGLTFGFALGFFGERIVRSLFGPDFRELVLLMPWFGILFFLRFVSAGWGVCLTALGEQTYRTKIGIGFWVVVLSAAIPAISLLGAAGWILSLSVGSLLLTGGYVLRVRRYLSISLALTATPLLALIAITLLLMQRV